MSSNAKEFVIDLNCLESDSDVDSSAFSSSSPTSSQQPFTQDFIDDFDQEVDGEVVERPPPSLKRKIPLSRSSEEVIDLTYSSESDEDNVTQSRVVMKTPSPQAVKRSQPTPSPESFPKYQKKFSSRSTYKKYAKANKISPEKLQLCFPITDAEGFSAVPKEVLRMGLKLPSLRGLRVSTSSLLHLLQISCFSCKTLMLFVYHVPNTFPLFAFTYFQSF